MHPLVPLFDRLLVDITCLRPSLAGSTQQLLTRLERREDFAMVVAGDQLAALQKDLTRIEAGRPLGDTESLGLVRDLVVLRQYFVKPLPYEDTTPPAAALAFLERLGARAERLPVCNWYFCTPPEAPGYMMGEGFQELFSAVRRRIDTPMTDPELAHLIRKELEAFERSLERSYALILHNLFFRKQSKLLKDLCEELGMSYQRIQQREDRLKVNAFRRIMRKHFFPSDPQQILIADCELTDRTVGRLRRGHVLTVGDLAAATDDQLRKLHLGPVGLAEVHTLLKQFGFTDKPTTEPGSHWPAHVDPAILDESVDILLLSTRAAEGLQQMSVQRIGELVQRKDEDLRRRSNFGRHSVQEIKTALHQRGLSLGMRISWRPNKKLQDGGS